MTWILFAYFIQCIYIILYIDLILSRYLYARLERFVLIVSFCFVSGKIEYFTYNVFGKIDDVHCNELETSTVGASIRSDIKFIFIRVYVWNFYINYTFTS